MRNERENCYKRHRYERDNKRILQTTSCHYIWKLDEMDKFLEKKYNLHKIKQSLYSLIIEKTVIYGLKLPT